ncbi:murein biosynthesis integral membrane protein MurJ [bacterium]|nr:murein biosynthesis integral membrane protein MurJ [bacterium]
MFGKDKIAETISKNKVFRTQQAGMAALFVTLATLLSTVLGLVRGKVMAHYFGAGLETDFYNYGTTIPDSLQNILIMGVTSASFIPIFAEHVANYSKEEANKLASSFLNVTLIVFSSVCLLVGIFMPQITDVWLTKDIPIENKTAIVDITRLFLLAQIAFAMSKVFSGILQTHKHFTAYALALLVYNPAIILGMILFHKEHGIYSAAYGAVAGACLVMAVNLLDLRGTDYRYNFSLDYKSAGIKSIYSLAIPNFLNMALLQLVFIAYSKISIDLAPGSYSAFRYALDFENFPVNIFGISFVTAIFPFLAENASKKNFINFNYNIQNSIRQILYLTLPAGAGMAVLSTEIIGLILGGGRFGAGEIEVTASILFYYALIVPLESLWYLYARAFYAMKDTWTPFYYRLAGTVINLAISYVLAYKIGPSAFSIGLLVAFIIQIGLFTFGLKRKVAEFDLKHAATVSSKLFGCTAAMVILVILCNYYLQHAAWMQPYSGRMQYLLRTLSGIGIGGVSYIGLTVVFKCADFSVLTRVVERIFKKDTK